MTIRVLTRIAVVVALAIGFSWASASVAEAVCGDGVLDGGEQCDDGNTTVGDCCDATCQFEVGGCCDGAGGCLAGGACLICFGSGTCQLQPQLCPCNASACPMGQGEFQLKQTAGGTLTVGTLPSFPFPAGGAITMDVGAGDANCVHTAIVPFPGGFSAPVFCIPALGFTVDVSQTACGGGALDSDGGSDYTITEDGDTSSPSCGLPHAGCAVGADSSIRVDVALGDGAADTCPTGGTVNAQTSIPVFTTTWLDVGGCPGPDGTFDPGLGDLLIVSFPQTLDFTTDTSTVTFKELPGDVDGCFIAGAGPVGPTVVAGICGDLTAGTITTAASGPIGSAGPPLFDLAFTTVLPNTIQGIGGVAGHTCASPPIIPGTRCIP